MLLVRPNSTLGVLFHIRTPYFILGRPISHWEVLGAVANHPHCAKNEVFHEEFIQ